LDRNCKVGNNTLIGPGSRLNDTAKVEGSVLGEDCVINGGAVVRGSYLWENVQVGMGCMIRESILGAGVFLEPEVIIERGCLIGEGVVIPSYTRIKEFSRISKNTLADAGTLPDPFPTPRCSRNFCGTAGAQRQSKNGYWIHDHAPQAEDSDEEDDPFESAANLRYLRLGEYMLPI
jgi:translation initiation factor eIF-2B subunit epsilon